MLLERKELKDVHTGEYFLECLYESSNIMKSVYIPDRKTLFIVFKKGVVYGYSNVDNENYLGFENSDSQGVYFSKNIQKNQKCVHYKMYKLYEFEKKDLLKLIEEQKQLLEEKNNLD